MSKKARIFGHVFDSVPDVTPAVFSTIESIRPSFKKVNKAQYPNWVLDYNFTKSDLYRVKNPTGPWKLREQNIAHLYAPGTLYWEKDSGKKVNVHCAWIIFDGGEQLGLDHITGQKGLARFIDYENILGQLLLKSASLGQEKGEAAFWAVQSVFYQIVEILKTAQFKSDQEYVISSSESEPDFVLQVQNYLKNNLPQKVTVKEIAAHFQMSESSLAHTYKNLTGQSPIATLIAMRINLAKNLLQRGYRLKTIAAQAGFNDEFHLSKAFKKHAGMSPKQFVNHK